ncbi:MAG: hypothetical protein R2827_10970 [Bdellovibrionales bacterium]
MSSVASGAMSFDNAVYIIFGANIGTTVTNAIVVLAHADRDREFRNVIPAAIIDDMYKLCNVGLFFVLEITTGFLQKLSLELSKVFFPGSVSGAWVDILPGFLISGGSYIFDTIVGWLLSRGVSYYVVAGILGLVSLLLLLVSLRIVSDIFARYF